MSTPTLRRFVISYSAMLTFMVAVSSYSVIQLGRLSAAAHIAVSIEQRMIDQADGLADAFLSEVRYGGKFSVTQAVVHYEQYKEFKADFEANDLTYEHRWQPHELIVWDNRSVLHRATEYDPRTERRVVRRCTVLGEEPVGATAA